MQLIGLAYDAIWHGLQHPGVEPQTRREMIAHLTTVHLPLYIGVLSVFVTTAWAFAEAMRRSRVERYPPRREGDGHPCQPPRDRDDRPCPASRERGYGLLVVLVGASLSMIGEVWHAVVHLRLDTHSGPVAGSLSPLGLVVVAAALWCVGRGSARDAAERDQRRAA